MQEGRWNDPMQDAVYASHYPLAAFVERADHLARNVTIQSALSVWGAPVEHQIVVYSFAPLAAREESVWDGRREQLPSWKGLLNPGPPYTPSQGLAIAAIETTDCHRFIAPSRPVLQRYRRIAWNSVFYVCSRDGQPCGSQLPDRRQLQQVLERSGTDFPTADDLTFLP